MGTYPAPAAPMYPAAPWLLLIALASAHAEEADQRCVDLHLAGVRSDLGFVRVAVFDNAEAFEQSRGELLLLNLPAIGGHMDTKLCGAWTQQVAVAVFHDENQNMELDATLGIPREGFGFSRNPSLLSGKPRFHEIALVLGGEPLEIELTYLF
jgi:uncharacterized protein (DUF2141 family)